jgi:hypothetical protein
VGGPELAALLLVEVLDREVVVVPNAEAVAAPVLVALGVEVVVLATEATVGLLEPPPHPATRTAPTKAVAASRRARVERVSRFGWLLSCIWAPSGLLESARRFYATGGYAKVALPETAD